MIETGQDKNDLMTLFRCTCKDSLMRELVNDIISFDHKGSGPGHNSNLALYSQSRMAKMGWLYGPFLSIFEVI